LLKPIIITSLGLVLILEGILPLLFPNLWQNLIRNISNYNPGQLRTYGLAMLVMGLIVLFYGIQSL
jgi:uncharacterized protein YjeT (DUF2065 family)